VQRVGLIGVCTLVLAIPYLGMKCVQGHTVEATICARLANIPYPPLPSPEQEFTVEYVNSVLATIREELGCG
jgi:hypothetical protein